MLQGNHKEIEVLASMKLAKISTKLVREKAMKEIVKNMKKVIKDWKEKSVKGKGVKGKVTPTPCEYCKEVCKLTPNAAAFKECQVCDKPQHLKCSNIKQIDRKAYGMNRDSLMDKLEQEGLQTRPVWQLNHLQKPYKNFPICCDGVKNTEFLCKNVISLPMHPYLTLEQITYICKNIHQLLN